MQGVADVKSTDFAMRQTWFAAGVAVLPLIHL